MRTQSWNQCKITDALHLNMLYLYNNLDDKYIEYYIHLNSVERNNEPAQLENFSSRFKKNVSAQRLDGKESPYGNHNYVALGQLLHDSTPMLIHSCPMEGFETEVSDVILGLSAQNLRATVVCALGYRQMMILIST